MSLPPPLPTSAVKRAPPGTPIRTPEPPTPRSPAPVARSRTYDATVAKGQELHVEVGVVKPPLFHGDGTVMAVYLLARAPKDTLAVGDTIVSIDGDDYRDRPFAEVLAAARAPSTRCITFRRVMDEGALAEKKKAAAAVMLAKQAKTLNHNRKELTASSRWRSLNPGADMPFVFRVSFDVLPIGIDVRRVFPNKFGSSVAIVEAVHPLKPCPVLPGDSVVGVNGKSVRHLAFSDIVTAVRSASLPLTVEFYRVPGAEEQMRKSMGPSTLARRLLAASGDTYTSSPGSIVRPFTGMSGKDQDRAFLAASAFATADKKKLKLTPKQVLSPNSKWRRAQEVLLPFSYSITWESAGTALGVKLEKRSPPKVEQSVAVVTEVTSTAVTDKIKVGDSLVAINGQNVRSLTFVNIHRLLKGAKFPRQLTFHRKPTLSAL